MSPAAPGVSLILDGTFRAEDSRLDYEGADFDKFALMQGGRRIGEVTAQRGRRTVTVRNVILYDEALAGQGLGKAVYAMLASYYKGNEIRSSFSVNIVKGQQSVGLSGQAIRMWDSLVVRDLAVKQVSADQRFFYRLAKAPPPREAIIPKPHKTLRRPGS